MPVPETHFVNGHPFTSPFPAGMAKVLFALGCFWGAEPQSGAVQEARHHPSDPVQARQNPSCLLAGEHHR